MTDERAVMLVKKVTYFGEFGYLNSSCIRKKVLLQRFWVLREINSRFCSKTQWQMFLLVSDRHIDDQHSQLQKRERTGKSFLYWLDWKSKHFNWNVTEWKATQPSLRVFCRKLFQWEPRKSCKIPYKSYNFVACLPNPYKLSILGDIWRATIWPFFSSIYFYSWWRLLRSV